MSIPGLLSQRSPTLDLGSLYGKGPQEQPQWYEADGMHLRRGTPLNFESPNAAKPGFDVPRWGAEGAGLANPVPLRRARIPDARNDENLSVAQVHTPPSSASTSASSTTSWPARRPAPARRCSIAHAAS